MIVALARVTALLLLAPFLTLASALAPQHVHEPGPGHDHAVAHSHFAAHEQALQHGDDVTEIEHDIEHVVYLDGAFVHTTGFRVAPVRSAVLPHQSQICLATRWTVTPADDIPPAHGPPKRCPFFRGPPSLLV
ncbi:MAG TPA: hypothetical protein VLV86_14645 [Vicinamibacterales bacterium]|nr:hypothetical protein [Vicinamibacterales bacterium]